MFKLLARTLSCTCIVPDCTCTPPGAKIKMSSNEEESSKPFACDSDFQFCEACASTIPRKELMQGTPSTENPLQGWTNKRCYPSFELAAKDRHKRPPEPASREGVPPKTIPFTSKFFNTCVVYGAGMPRGTHVWATREDVPHGQQRWFDFHHYNTMTSFRWSLLLLPQGNLQ